MNKPSFPKPYARDGGFPKQTPWDPNKPASAVDNRPPQSLWPHKEGSAVFYIEGFSIFAGRVGWFQPAREIDASCCVSVGHPYFKISDDHRRTHLIPSEHTFKYSTAGWKAAKKKIAELFLRESEDLAKRASENLREGSEFLSAAVTLLSRL